MGKVLSRHNILFPENEYLEIKDYCKKIGISVSQFIRELAIHKVREAEDKNLLNFINQNCSFVEKEEQEEIDIFMKNRKDDDEFFEVTLDDILQG
ncbi:MAG: plasmid mobilization protein [Cetobacterium sp.]